MYIDDIIERWEQSRKNVLNRRCEDNVDVAIKAIMKGTIDEFLKDLEELKRCQSS